MTYKRTGVVGRNRLLNSVMWDDSAHKRFPEVYVCRRQPKTWCAPAAHASYTTNPVMYRIVFAKDLYSRVPRENLTFRSFEPTLTAFWTKSNYTVANPDAIFTHNRLDRTLGVAGRWVTVDV